MDIRLECKTQNTQKKKNRENFCGTALCYKFLDPKPEAVLIKEKK